NLNSFNWQTVYNRWQSNFPVPNFSAWLENGANFFLIWSPPYTQWIYGLNLEPTFNLRNPSTTTFLWQPPLFQSYQATGTNAPYAGYRWRVLSVQEQP
ncbi:MAG TPA: hypothetical protein VHB77_02545, partial [Planctomycetaceae bacterium]|nr:hypothetical protein [Planctomycetaceae bacterium]